MESGMLAGKPHNVVEDQESLADPSSIKCDGDSLPSEIVLEVLSYIRDTPEAQATFWSCCLVSRQWYACAVSFLYEQPYLYGRNFDPFAATICPSINLHVRKSPLAEYVRQLDMGRLVHQGSKSMTARILGRVKDRLQGFVAPQASFAINCLAALSKCSKLTVLDLSLILQAIPLDSLLRCLSRLPNLRILYFPRLSDDEANLLPEQWAWPPTLRELWITNGGIPDSFLRKISGLPRTLDTLTIQRCAKVSPSALHRLLDMLAIHLRVLRIAELPQLRRTSLDTVLHRCPYLEQLSIPINNITQGFFEHYSEVEYIEITTSLDGAGVWGITPVDIYMAIADELFTHLRGVCYPGALLKLSEEHDREFYTLDCVLLERQGREESFRDQTGQLHIDMTLRLMAENDLVGAYTWFPGYDARNELRAH